MAADMLVAKLDAKTGNAIWVLTAGDEKDQSHNRRGCDQYWHRCGGHLHR
jgi:hypothetical protein